MASDFKALRDSIWDRVGWVMNKVPVDDRSTVIAFFSNLTFTGKINRELAYFIKDVMALLEPNPNRRPDNSPRARDLEDSYGWMGTVEGLRSDLDRAWIFLDDAYMRVDSINNGFYNSETEKELGEELLRTVAGMSTNEGWFKWLAEDASYHPTLENLASRIKLIHDVDPLVEKLASKINMSQAITVAFGLNPFMNNRTELNKRIEAWMDEARHRKENEKDQGDQGFADLCDEVEKILSPLRSLAAMGSPFMGQDMDTMVIHLRRAPNFKSVSSFETVIRRVVSGDNLKNLNASDSAGRQLQVLWNAIKNKGMSKEGALDELDAAVAKVMDPVEALKNMKPESLPGDEDPVYGKFLFAPERPRQVPTEPNTPREQAAYEELTSHIFDNQPIEPDVALDLMGALERGEYTRILHEPKTEHVFRGIKLNDVRLMKLLGMDEDAELEKTGSKVIDRQVSNPKGQGSSAWSTDLESAANFSDATGFSAYSVILVARMDDNPDTFLEGPGGFYDVPGFKSYKHEKESIALGPVRVHKVYWQHNPGGRVFDMPVEEAPGGVEEGLLKLFIRQTLLG